MRKRHPISIVLAACLLAGLLLAPAGAEGATLTRKNSTLRYIAKAGEVNDIKVSKGFFFVPVIRFHDDGAVISTDDPANCNVVSGNGLCQLFGITKIYVNVKDRNDTVNVNASRDEELFLPVNIRTTLIGGRGIDVLFGGKGRDKLKGNAGRDSIRGRRGVDRLKGGRGSDQLYALDGLADKAILCGGGRRDQVKFDHGKDPKPRSCELGTS